MSKTLFIKSAGNISDDFGTLLPAHFYHYLNFGQWSLHELLAFILEYTGPAHVKVTSYGISESAIRSFVNMIDCGSILSLDLLFDISTKRNKFALLMFAHNVASRVFVNANHAKLISVQNEKITIIVNASANLTVNRRNEAGCIITEQNTALQFHDAIVELIESSILLNPDNEPD
jgi:hypothetical protein